MTPFLFLKLPFLAQKIIIQQIDPNIKDVVELSMINRKLKRIFDLMKFEVKLVHFMFDNNYFAFNIKSESHSVNIASSFFTRRGIKNRKIDGDLVPVSYLNWNTLIGECEFNTDTSRLDLLEKFARHFLSFLNVQKFSVEFRRSNPGVRNLFIWKYINRSEKITFAHGDNVSQFPQSLQITSDDLVFLLENISTDYLFLNTLLSDNPGFKYLFPLASAPFKIRNIKFLKSSWMDFDSLLRMDVESMEIAVPREFINKFLKNWIDGTNEKLEHLKFNCESLSDDVMEGVNSTPSKFTKEELRTRTNNWCIQLLGELPGITAKDIRRNHDGCLATVIVSNNMIEMLVWNEKHLEAIGRN